VFFGSEGAVQIGKGIASPSSGLTVERDAETNYLSSFLILLLLLYSVPRRPSRLSRRINAGIKCGLARALRVAGLQQPFLDVHERENFGPETFANTRHVCRAMP
jgi:hypothetical protein